MAVAGSTIANQPSTPLVLPLTLNGSYLAYVVAYSLSTVPSVLVEELANESLIVVKREQLKAAIEVPPQFLK